MACRGVHFAIEPAMMTRLLEARSDSSVLEVVQDIEQQWDEPWLHQSDKSWDALHRCLGDGTLKIPAQFEPLFAAVMGGEQLHAKDSFIISLVRPEQVREVATALAQVTQEWLRERYDALDPDNYEGDIGDDDFEYTWDWFTGLPALFKEAGNTGRAMVFVVDQ